MDRTREPLSSEGTNDAPHTVQDCSLFDFTCVTEAVSVVIDRSDLIILVCQFHHSEVR